MRRILLLDDNEDILYVMAEVLIDAGFAVECRMSGAGFIAEAKVIRPDLFILDYKLADGNGGEICRELKLIPEFSAVPVIICSAYTDHKVDLETFGCQAVIKKPFDLDHLVGTVNGLLKVDAR